MGDEITQPFSYLQPTDRHTDGRAGKQTDSLMPVYPDCKVRGANMGPIWGRQDPGGPHVGPMNLTIWVPFPCWVEGIHVWASRHIVYQKGIISLDFAKHMYSVYCAFMFIVLMLRFSSQNKYRFQYFRFRGEHLYYKLTVL